MPNSITDLNDFSDDLVPYEDARAYTANVSVASNANVILTGNEPHDLPVGITVNELSSLPGNVTITVDFSGSANITNATPYVGWAAETFPANVTYSAAANVFTLTGFIDKSVWDRYGAPEIFVAGQDVPYVYTANFAFPNVANTSNIDTRSWSVDVTVNGVGAGLTNPADTTWLEDQPIVLGNTAPEISDFYDGPLPYILTIQPNTANSVLNIVESGTGNSVYNSATQTLTITDVRDRVNSSLGNITITPRPDFATTFSLTYQLTAPISNAVTAKTQVLTVTAHDEYTLTTDYTYNEDEDVTLVFQVTDNAVSTMQYTSTIQQITPDPAVNPGRFRINGTFQSAAINYARVANRAVINADTVEYFPPGDFASNISLAYTQIRHDPDVGDITQANAVPMTLAIGNTHNEYSITTTYNYDEDQGVSMVFDVLDLDPEAATFTSTFTQQTGNTGYWYVDGVLQGAGTGSITDTKANVNAANVYWVPYPDATDATVEIFYNQSKTSTGNVVTPQATNVLVTMNLANSHTDYTLTTAHDYSTWEALDLTGTYAVTDTDIRATAFTVTFDQISGNTGRFLLANVDQGVGNSVTITGNIATVNAANIRFSPDPTGAGTIELRYVQTKTSALGPTVEQANAVVTLTDTSDTGYLLTTNYTVTENTNQRMTGNITVTDNLSSYTTSYRYTGGNGLAANSWILSQVDGTRYVISDYYDNGTVIANTNNWVSNVTVTGTAAEINAANITMRNAAGNTATYPMAFSATQHHSLWGNTVMATDVPVSIAVTPTAPVTVTTTASANEGGAAALTYTMFDDPDILRTTYDQAFLIWDYDEANISGLKFGVVFDGNTYGLYDPDSFGGYPGSWRLDLSNTIASYNQQSWFAHGADQVGSFTVPWVFTSSLAWITPTQAGNVLSTTGNITVTYANDHPEYNILASTYDQDTEVTPVFEITDQDPFVEYYTVNLSQVTPDPATNAGLWIKTEGNVNYGRTGNTGNVTGNIQTVGNAASWTYYPPWGYQGNVVLRLNQWKLVDTIGNIQQANNVDFTLSVGNTYSFLANVPASLSFDMNPYPTPFTQSANIDLGGITVLEPLDPLSEWQYKMSFTTTGNALQTGGVYTGPVPLGGSQASINYGTGIEDTMVSNSRPYTGNRASTASTQTYNNVPVYTVTGGGSGATANVTVYANAAGAWDRVQVTTGSTPGRDYKAADRIRILGNTIGQATPDNDLFIDMQSVSYGQGDFTFNNTQAANIWADTTISYNTGALNEPVWQFLGYDVSNTTVFMNTLLANTRIGGKLREFDTPTGLANGDSTTMQVGLYAVPRGEGTSGNVLLSTANITVTRSDT